jgi:hypothetical protein
LPKIVAFVSRFLIVNTCGIKPCTMGTYRTYGNSIMPQDCKYMSLSVNESNIPMV